MLLSFWSDSKKRAWIYQSLIVIGVLALVYWMFSNAQANLSKQNISQGFGFLWNQSGFDIGSSFIAYSSDHSYLKALTVGLINTLYMAIIGNAFALLWGLVLGICSLSNNWILSKLCRVYIEFIRNIPLLLQLLFWYSICTEILPNVREASSTLPGVFFTNRGIFLPSWSFSEGWSLPVLEGFNFQGGFHISPEFLALFLGLVLYTGAFNAEIIRSGILSVKKGQWEASSALGLTRLQSLRLVILPQALRLIIPPMISQLLNLTKNSSLAVAVGYPDLVSVSNTTLNQTGQAIEVITLIMAVYLTISLITAFIGNLYAKSVAIVGR